MLEFAAEGPYVDSHVVVYCDLRPFAVGVADQIGLCSFLMSVLALEHNQRSFHFMSIFTHGTRHHPCITLTPVFLKNRGWGKNMNRPRPL